jgi:hypothetical protein
VAKSIVRQAFCETKSVRFRHLTPALATVALLLAACDPNVVIGAKWRVGEAPTAGTNSGTAGVDTGGSGGSGAGGTDAAGTSGVTSVEGGAAGQPGLDGTIYFQADHEGDDTLGIWDEGPDMDAGGYYADDDPPIYSDAQAHSGQGSAQVTIDTSASSGTISRLYRRVESDSAYYSAWFYLNEDHTPSQWWSIFLFRARRDRSNSLDLWSLDLIRVEDEDRLSISIYDHPRSDVIDVPSLPTIPIAEWFHLEALLEFAPDQPSRLELWLNGEQVFSRPDLTEMPADEPAYWVIGNGGSLLDPPVSTLFIDDAIVSATRVGSD